MSDLNRREAMLAAGAGAAAMALAPAGAAQAQASAPPAFAGQHQPKPLRFDPTKLNGFQLAQESDLLANPADDRTKMVFTPGTRGTTDQAFFIFRKPN